MTLSSENAVHTLIVKTHVPLEFRETFARLLLSHTESIGGLGEIKIEVCLEEQYWQEVDPTDFTLLYTWVNDPQARDLKAIIISQFNAANFDCTILPALKTFDTIYFNPYSRFFFD